MASALLQAFSSDFQSEDLSCLHLILGATLLVDIEIKDSVTNFDILLIANTSFPLIIVHALTMCAKTKNPNFSLFSLAHWADRFPSLEWRSGLVVRSSTNCFASEEYFSIVLGQWHSFYEDRWKNHTLKHMHTTMIWLIWYDLCGKSKEEVFFCPKDDLSINAHLVSGLNCWDLIRTRAGGSSDPLSNSLKTSHKWGFRCHKFTYWISHKYRDLAETEAARSCLLLPTGWRAALNWRLCSTGEATHVRDARQSNMFNPKPPQKR